MSAVGTTVPLQPVRGMAARNYRVGDRVTWLYTNESDQQVRLVGTVTSSDSCTFVVRWDANRGEARFAHNHEPDTFRAATVHDERDALTRGTRATVAAELNRLADTNTVWPGEVRRTLRARAADLTR